MICATENAREDRKLLTVGTRLRSKYVGSEAQIIETVPPGSRTKEGVTNTTEEAWYRQEFQDGSTIWATLDGFEVLAAENPLVADDVCPELGDVVLILTSKEESLAGHNFLPGTLGIIVDLDMYGSESYPLVEQHIINGRGIYGPVWQTLDFADFAVVQVPDA